MLLKFLNVNHQLNSQLKNAKPWEDTKNLYVLQERSLFIENDLVKDDENNLKILEVYSDLFNLANAFIIDTRNFIRIPNLNNNNYQFSYMESLRGMEDVFSPYGNNILIDYNYLKRRPIYSFDEGNVKEKIVFDDNVLNILVPQKYKTNEKIIKENYLNWFYFQKVEVSNIYKEKKGEEQSNIKIKDLSINLVYIKNNNKYFSYNINTGHQYDNKIVDPIITVYTGNVDNSVLASTVGVSLLFESDDYKEASKIIGQVTQENSAPSLNAFTSVYERKGEEIDLLQERKRNFIINMLTILVIISIITIYITYIYYESNRVKIAVQSLFGYDFFSLNVNMFIINKIIYGIILMVSNFIFKTPFKLSLLVIFFIILLDILAKLIIYKTLLKEGELEFIKEIL